MDHLKYDKIDKIIMNNLSSCDKYAATIKHMRNQGQIYFALIELFPSDIINLILLYSDKN